jgi:hypothetical protein
MKTTVEIPDELYRRAKAEAALRGRKLKDLVEEGLRLELERAPATRRHPNLAGLMKEARGTSIREFPTSLPMLRISWALAVARAAGVDASV